MTPVPGPHLTPDDLDAWLAGALAPAAQAHLTGCPACQERAETEREVVALLEALPLMSPAADF
jgi:anti-sigma factor RsiW